MIHPGTAVQEAVYLALKSSGPLVSMLGGEHVFDDVPPKQKPPYVVIGASVHRDWSTGTEDGMEHEIKLHVWSSENGRKQVLAIAGEIIAALQTTQSALNGHVLVNLTHEFTRVSKDTKSELFSAELNFRALTEPA